MKFKKITASLLAVLLLFSLLIPAAFAEEQVAATRGEVVQMLLNAADDYNPGVVKTDIIKGYEDGQLHEERSVTRAEALIMLKRAFGDLPTPTGHNARVALKAENFTDIPEWAKPELQNVFDTGIVAGTAEGVFSPDALVTGEQMGLFIHRVFALYGTNKKDNFYAAVNRETLETMEIKPGMPGTDTISELSMKAMEQVSEILMEIMAQDWEKGSREYKMSALFASILDQEARDQTGIAPIAPYLEMIDGAGNTEELTKIQSVLENELCTEPFFFFDLDIDRKDSTSCILSFDTASASFQDEVYTESSSKRDAILTYWKTLLMLGGETEEDAQVMANRRLEMEKYIYDNTMDAVDYDDVNKIYNIFTLAEVKELSPDTDIESALESAGLMNTDKIMIMDVDKTKAFFAYYQDENLDALKAFAKLEIISEWGDMLNHEFTEARQQLYQAYYGVEGSASPEEEALQYVQSIMEGYIGELYIERYFSEEAKKDVEKMVDDMIAVYRKMLENNSWLSEETKEKAIEKLDKMSVKIGYPDKWDNANLNNAEILAPEDGGTFFGNMLAIEKSSRALYPEIQFEEIDKSQWVMPVYEANACYNSAFNDITFPAAFLQAPMYDVHASYEQNLGGIGFAIAHEITHAFDTTGAQYDADGNASDWWTEADYAAFVEKCEAMAAFYDGQEAIPGVLLNGYLTLGENIADNGAISCVTEVASGLENPDFKALYESFAKCWAITATREYFEDVTQTDEHCIGAPRVNRTVANCDTFYEAFGITEEDGMYVAPEDRVKIW